jgi:hypothetical protein
MADEPTKDPKFTKPEEIEAENERRKKSIEQCLKLSESQIRMTISCTLAEEVGRAMAPPKSEVLYIMKRWLILPADDKAHDDLSTRQVALTYGSSGGWPPDEENKTANELKDIETKLNEIYQRGSQHVRESVGKAAAWACVPAEMLAAVIQNENGKGASNFKKDLQNAERWANNTWVWKKVLGPGSTGLGNVKSDTLSKAKALFKDYYKMSILGKGVKDSKQNDNAETDIYHAAAVLRDCLNKAWSAGNRSLNKDEFKKYRYYPYFGGVVTKDVATRAMGHYNGMGDDALKYGTDGMKEDSVTDTTLHAAEVTSPGYKAGTRLSW